MIETIEKFVSGRANLLASLVLTLFAACTLIQSAVRPFWNDEYFTIAVAEQPSLSAMSAALDKGVDLNPPLFHLATRAATTLAGFNRVGLRLPAVVGFALMMFGIFRFVSILWGPACGLVAMMLPALTGLEFYASEGRAYGLMLGFVALAILAWQSSSRRWTGSCLCGVILVCAVLSHSYAVFVLGPLVLAEIVRSARSGKWNLHFAFAVILPLAAFVLALQQSRKGMAINSAGYTANFFSIVDFYSTLFGPFGIVAALLLAALVALWFLPRLPESETRERPHPSAEITLAVGLFLLPFAIVPLSSLAKLPFLFRYSASSGIGFALLFGWFVFLLRRWRTPSGLIAFFLIGGSFVLQESWPVARYVRHGQTVPERAAFEDPEARTMPVFAQDPYLYLEMLFNWPVEKRPDLHYVLDIPIAQRMMGGSTTEVNIMQLVPVRPLQLETYAELRSRPSQFLLYYDTAMNRDEIKGWLLKKLLDDHTPVQLLRRHGDIFVYLVSIP